MSAARQVLTQRGYDHSSMGAIADASGIAKANLYQYFADRDAIIAVVVDEIMADVVEGIGQRLQAALTTGDPATGPDLITGVFDQLDTHRPVLNAIVRSAPHLLPPSAFAPISQRWGDVTRALLAIKAFGRYDDRPEVDAEALVEILSVCGPAMCLHYLSRDNRERRRVLARTYYSMAFGGIVAAGLHHPSATEEPSHEAT
ncbi:TetR/AcrR family transcriptional regulator [Mycobacterium sp. PDNC021]|uniref:TetR/AcrR family transcriptional regulator n=1 Tax=Mycobacterium sp. PDNC021 TaxID=3391399 RepID=UPI003AAE7EA7